MLERPGISNFEGKWPKINFVIENGVIKEKPGLDVVFYNPFDYHYKNSSYQDKSKKSLYLEFIEIDEKDEQQILAFVNNYGILGLELIKQGKDIIGFVMERFAKLHRPNEQGMLTVLGRSSLPSIGSLINRVVKVDKREIEIFADENIYDGELDEIRQAFNELVYDNGLVLTERIDEFIGELVLMRLLVRANAAINKGDIEAIKEISADLLNAVKRNAYLDGLDILSELDTSLLEPSPSGFSDILSFWIKIYSSRHLKRAYPTLESSKGSKTHRQVVGYKCSDLLAAMYIMFMLDATRGLTHRLCANEPCKQPFMPQDDRQIYCSEPCARAQVQREYRRRKKLDQNMNES